MSRLRARLEKIGRDPKVTARSVGLRYTAGYGKGFYRKRRGKGFYYVDEHQKKVVDPEILQRIEKLVIPPAWENVWICPFDNGHLQVTGTDARGRKQYRYHHQWNKIRNQAKFFRLRRFAVALPQIRAAVDRDLARKGLPYEKVVALAVKLIELTHIRVGNDAYKKLYGSFGLTTLRDKHVKINNSSSITFDFIGKKGVRHQVQLQSKRLAQLVKRCRDLPGQELFQYIDDDGNRCTIGSADVNQYLKSVAGEEFTAKDFRAWAGSVHALCGFREAGSFVSDAECKRKIATVIDNVAKKLGNTRTVCRKYYIDPTVIVTYEAGRIDRYDIRADIADNSLTPDEEALVRLLEAEKIAEVNC